MRSNNKYSLTLYALIAILLLSSFAKYNSTNATSHAIQGGQEYPDQDNPPKWIGALYYNKGDETKSPMCTVEFLSPRYILTALHCITDRKLSDFKVQYRELKNSRPIYPLVGIESAIVYKAYNTGYDIVLLRLIKSYPAPVEMVPIYHNYSFNPYDVQNHAPVKDLGYGILNANPKVLNKNSILKQLKGNIVNVHYNPTRIVTKSTRGTTLGGDSGGPLLITTLFTDKLIGVHSGSVGVINSSSSALLLSMPLLKWISVNTKVAIFNRPLEQELIVPSRDDSLLVSGWGGVPFGSQVVVYSSSDGYVTPVASCDKFTYPANNEWQCKVQFDNKYNYSKSNDYKVSLLSVNKQMDYVYFKISESGQSIKIQHPKKSTVTEGKTVEWFIYHTPVGESYLVTGIATPSTYLTYNLIDKKTGRSNKAPCANATEAFSSVPRTGVWKCRIMVNSQESKIYTFEVGLDKSKEPISSNRKRPLEPKVDNVEYKVSPLAYSPMLDIISPANRSINVKPYKIEINIKHDIIPLTLRREMKAEFGPPYNALVTIASGVDTYSKIITNDGETFYGATNLFVKVYLDGDQEPIAESSINYFVKEDYFIKFTLPQQNAQIAQGEAIYPEGVAIDITGVVSAPKLIVRVYSTRLDNNSIKLICEASINSGKWNCPRNLKVSIADLPEGEYKLTANLLDADNLSKHYATSPTVVISITKNVGISSPQPSTSVSRSKKELRFIIN